MGEEAWTEVKKKKGGREEERREGGEGGGGGGGGGQAAEGGQGGRHLLHRGPEGESPLTSSQATNHFNALNNKHLHLTILSLLCSAFTNFTFLQSCQGVKSLSNLQIVYIYHKKYFSTNAMHSWSQSILPVFA